VLEALKRAFTLPASVVVHSPVLVALFTPCAITAKLLLKESSAYQNKNSYSAPYLCLRLSIFLSFSCCTWCNLSSTCRNSIPHSWHLVTGWRWTFLACCTSSSLLLNFSVHNLQRFLLRCKKSIICTIVYDIVGYKDHCPIVRLTHIIAIILL
jgi:hypothetical protein